MGQITSGIGLVSGINSSQIITQLLSLDSAPVKSLQNRVSANTAVKTAFTGLASQIDALKTVGTTLSNPTSFQAAATNSSDPNTLTATATTGAATGTYQLQVAQLVSSQQAISGGFADPNQTKVGAGTLTISQGGGEVSTATALSTLNGGAGVRRGIFRITDRSGKSQAIDISSAVTLDDVVKKINTSLDISVKASVGKNGIVLTDLTGVTDPPAAGQPAAHNLTVQDLGDGHTAADLGLVGNVAANTITGTGINTVGRATALALVNDGRGVRTANAGDDFRVLAADGSTFDVNVGTAKTIGQVLDAINTASGGKVVAGVSADGSGIQLSDGTGSGGSITVAALNSSNAAADLGIAGTGGGGALVGKPLIAALDSTLVSSLNGGAGLALGSITLADRSGASATVNLAGATSVKDILDAINGAGLGVTASVSDSGGGIKLTDTTGGAKPLTVSDVDSTTAQALGLAGSFTANTVNGANLHHQFVTANSSLKDYNGGKGVTPGKFTITSSSGQSSQIDLTTGNYTTLGDVIKTINARNIGVTASVNANGNGLLLTDTANGATKLKVVDDSGSAAADLNLAGTATASTIDGAFEKTINVTANDTLSTVQQKINDLGFGVSASVINDGSGATPYRLSLNARNTGRDGRFVFDAGQTGLATSNLVDAQDAAVFIGGQNSAHPLLVTSSSNQITNVIKGVTVNLLNTSATPVTLSVTKDSSSISTQLKNFTDGFNAVVTQLDGLTSFDPKTNTPGLLLGDSTALTIESSLYDLYNSAVKGGGRFHTLADLGITIASGTGSAQLQFDANKFSSAFATDPTAVQNLFSKGSNALGTIITSKIATLTDPINGAIPIETKAIDSQNQSFQDRISQLNDQLAQKKTQLQNQFNNMETVLAGLQSQQSALASLGTISPLTSTSKTSSSSSSSSSSSGSGSASGTSG